MRECEHSLSALGVFFVDLVCSIAIMDWPLGRLTFAQETLSVRLVVGITQTPMFSRCRGPYDQEILGDHLAQRGSQLHLGFGDLCPGL
jgi:hypothetical protein